MTVALGASAYSVAIFHLMTHAFFKALLFLAAGSVIIGMHHDQDIRNMGGLRKYMPITWLTSLVGSLALIGTPFLSGFYSKDSIIEAVALSHTPGAKFAYFAVLAGVFVTAFYSFRMYFLVFHGEERFGKAHAHDAAHDKAHDTAHSKAHDAHANSHDEVHEEHHGLAPGQKPHESPMVVTMPLVALAVPSLIIGYMMVQPMLFGDFFIGSIFVNEVKHPAMRELQHHFMEHFHSAAGMGIHSLLSLPFFLALAGVVSSWYFYMKRPDIPAAIRQRCSLIYTLLDNKYYFDKFNEVVLAAGARLIGKGLWRGADMGFIDGLMVNGSAKLVNGFSGIVRHLQTGLVYHYAFSMIIGVFVLLTLWVTLA
jgi:NADH-quinone oxidoreductase subunit L